MDPLRDLFERQAGVVSRRQLIEREFNDIDIRRLVRRRQLTRVYPGIFINHTGPLSWTSRAWAAVLFHAPAVICHDSAVRLAGDVIHVGVAEERRTTSLPGVQVHRLSRFEERALLHLHPPRDRFEEALLDLAASAATPDEALTILADACQRGRTTSSRIRGMLTRRHRIRHGAWVRAALDDLDGGVRSVLESRYRRRVERAHGLPRGEGQRRTRTADGVVYRDVDYPDLGVIVELDGHWHRDEAKRRWDDMDRDLLAATDARITLRLGWRHCDTYACRTALRLAHVMKGRGWEGKPCGCGPGCLLTGDFQSPGD